MQALLLEQQDGKPRIKYRLWTSRLPESDVTVDVHWMSLNYKDAHGITVRKIIRNYRMIPGIDFADCTHQRDPRFMPSEVLLTGWALMKPWGWRKARERMCCTRRLEARKAMIIGTAGFTHRTVCDTLRTRGVRPQDGRLS